ncbi:MAG TPA: glycosyltransferase family 4 protein [Casimicrobiaceae bacterium]|nr:glycosyltransferase family 4 protein [Casimicrobiaceae bacterium]
MTGSPLRIAHTESSTGWGGQEIRVLREAAGFIARGHDVVVYAAPGARIVAEAPRFGVPAIALPIGGKRTRGALAMWRALAARPVDVVNTHSSTDSWLAALACRGLAMRRAGAPALVRTRHVSVPVQANRATRWLYRTATARIVTTGDTLREALIRDLALDPARVHSVPTGIDPARHPPIARADARAALGLPEATPIVGIVATLRSWKGHAYLIDALAQMRRHDALLVIVGDGPQRDALVRKVAAHALGERVRFVGQQDDVAPWLAALDVFALPSYANEGVPQALLQAMFAGVPSVTTDVGAIPEIAHAGSTAVVVPREDAEALAAAIDTLLDDPARGRTLAGNARELVSGRYTESHMLDRMHTVFREAVAARGARAEVK